MATATQFRHEHLAVPPRGSKVRTVTRDGHEIRLAFPKGTRQKGAGTLVSILHPVSENGACPLKKKNFSPTISWKDIPAGYVEVEPTAKGATLYGGRWIRPSKKKKLNPLAALVRGAAFGVASKLAGKFVSNPASVVYRGFELASRPDGEVLISVRERGQLYGYGSAPSLAAAKKKVDEMKAQGLGHNPHKRNTHHGAIGVYAEFHGRAPHEVLEFEEKHVKEGNYAALGDMGSLWFRPVSGEPSNWPPASLEFEKQDGVKLAADSKGRQMFFLGGNQTLPKNYLEDAGLDPSQDYVALGVCYAIAYKTEKSFDDFKNHEYGHMFGEETGEMPTAFYATKLKRILLIGGAYKIAPFDPKIGASPGIEN